MSRADFPETLMNSKEKIAYSWRSGWKPKAYTSFVLFPKGWGIWTAFWPGEGGIWTKIFPKIQMLGGARGRGGHVEASIWLVHKDHWQLHHIALLHMCVPLHLSSQVFFYCKMVIKDTHLPVLMYVYNCNLEAKAFNQEMLRRLWKNRQMLRLALNTVKWMNKFIKHFYFTPVHTVKNLHLIFGCNFCLLWNCLAID